ncbi:MULTISPECIES: translation elongation factor 4 [Apilactobacillus]|uniref:translation elongation factor 4 n=1 Tax=Apilactobacillus TaxID=2767877 RepID=UPI001363B3E6|nr:MULTISPECIES: translation elongation factor 4 [Apilactobacillus]MDN2612526.1 translation elongation factor 4 [Apilactobacillus sp. EABW-1NA]NBI01364.1 elongation factor 4 [Apilactobacillus kunkeei]CAI2666752.1 Elongation factor 4 [Apilactobacillus kunkeei]CAI2670872.1 Elongation factor 4 [Apilactobacillus kunkeei]
MKQANIRNFSIVAHIDHGKSTLSDQIMKMTDTFIFRGNEEQVLDDMKVEQDHGVTVRSRTVRNIYRDNDGQEYELNLIDTPGHVDFNYEVEKSVSASDGVILLVDSTKGVQAQTVANYRIAKNNNLVIIPVINKVDNQSAQVDMCEQQLYELDESFLEHDIIHISAKTGLNVDQVLEAIVNRIPSPKGDETKPLKAMIFDSHYDSYQGVVAYVKVIDGVIQANDKLMSMNQKVKFETPEVGIFSPQLLPLKELKPGDIGYVITGIKDPSDVRVGDTITGQSRQTNQAVAGYQPAHSVVFAGIYPKDADFDDLKVAMEKLKLNDSSIEFVEHVSNSLGPGYRCGFLGMFHLQIVRERLINEFGMSVIITSPNVNYCYTTKNDATLKTINNPSDLPDFSVLKTIEEPFNKVVIETPSETVNDVMTLLSKSRGVLLDMDNTDQLVKMIYSVPLAEIAFNFFNQLKSITHGFATYDSQFMEYVESDIVKITIDVNYAPVDELTFIVHRLSAEKLAQEIIHKLKYVIPRKLYPMPVQGYIEGRVVARVDVPPLRKNAAVSGDKKSVSKKQALLRRQSLNKRKSAIEAIQLPQSVFDAILNIE